MRVSGTNDRLRAASSSRELAGADQLIADLAALLDAGLVVVDEPVLGPARYAVAPMPDHHHADDRRGARSCVGIMHG